MNKIALCLSGYFNSLTDKTSFGEDGFSYIERNIQNKVSSESQVDIFFHNWEPDMEEKLVDMYKPKKYIVESQIDFNKIAEENGVSRKDLDSNNQLGSWTMDSKVGSGLAGPERILSQFYSLQKSIELKKEYEEENNFKYDCVIKARFDLGRINRNTSGPGKGNPYACQCIKFDETLDMDAFYQVYWDLFNEGPADMWFYSNSENMDNFCTLYDKTLNEYLKLNSDYHKVTMEGRPQSKLNDFRSNELFKENPTENLHKYKPHEFVNAILLYKWFLIDCELWYNSVALMTEWE